MFSRSMITVSAKLRLSDSSLRNIQDSLQLWAAERDSSNRNRWPCPHSDPEYKPRVVAILICGILRRQNIQIQNRLPREILEEARNAYMCPNSNDMLLQHA